jgi:hypothetical protein
VAPKYASFGPLPSVSRPAASGTRCRGGDGQVLRQVLDLAELVVDDRLPRDLEPATELPDREVVQRLGDAPLGVLGELGTGSSGAAAHQVDEPLLLEVADRGATAVLPTRSGEVLVPLDHLAVEDLERGGAEVVGRQRLLQLSTRGGCRRRRGP